MCFAPRVDANEDSIADDWALAHGLGPDDALLDRDGDGGTNQNEFLAGTNLDDPKSGFRVTEIKRDPDVIAITFQSVPGRFYVLDATTNVADGASWTPIVPNIIAVSTSTTVRDPDSLAFPNRVYRLRVLHERE